MQSAVQNASIDRSTLAIVMIDLDGFKNVNDRLGHNAGDDFLRHVATALRESVRAGDSSRASAATSSSCCSNAPRRRPPSASRRRC